MIAATPFASSELKPLDTISRLPEELWTDWDVVHHSLSDPKWNSFTPKIFDAIDYAEQAPGHRTYAGYRQNRVATAAGHFPAMHLFIDTIGGDSETRILRAHPVEAITAPSEGPALYIAETKGIHVVGRGAVYMGSAGHEVPQVGFFTANAGSMPEDDMRRLTVMNAASTRRLGDFLHSGNNMSEREQTAWLRLTQEGAAQQVEVGGAERFRFIAQPLVASI